MSKTSIFDLERRTDLLQDYLDFEQEYVSTYVQTRNFSDLLIMDLLDRVIKEWPYREAASSVKAYLIKKGIPGAPRNTIDALYIMELWVNLMHWAPTCDKKHDTEFSSLYDSLVDLDLYIENIEYVLEQCNYRIRKDEDRKIGCPRYVITKRDAAVDAAIEAAPELSDILLSYMDVRNQNSIDYKKEALREIGNHFEAIKDSFKGTSYSSLWDSLSFALNTFQIRHNNNKQIKLPHNERIRIYDNAFKISLFLLQSSNVAAYKKDIDSYKEH